FGALCHPADCACRRIATHSDHPFNPALTCWAIEMSSLRDLQIPQGLKPLVLPDFHGRAKALPLRKKNIQQITARARAPAPRSATATARSYLRQSFQTPA